jgi:hypothetical protein
MRTLASFWALWFLGGAVSAGVAADTAPSRPVLPRETGVAPPTRIRATTPESVQPQGTPVATADIPKTVRRAVVADAAKRFAVAESAVVLARAEQVTWGDRSLGCPEPGVYYTQDLVPGYIVVANTGSGELTYHTDTLEQAKSCASARPKTNQILPEQSPGRAQPPPADR